MVIVVESSIRGTSDSHRLLLGCDRIHDVLQVLRTRCLLLGTSWIQRSVDLGDSGAFDLSSGIQIKHHWTHHWKFTRATQLATSMGIKDVTGHYHDTRFLLLKRMGTSRLRQTRALHDAYGEVWYGSVGSPRLDIHHFTVTYASNGLRVLRYAAYRCGSSLPLASLRSRASIRTI